MVRPPSFYRKSTLIDTLASVPTYFGENTDECPIHRSIFCRHVMHYLFGKGDFPFGISLRVVCRCYHYHHNHERTIMVRPRSFYRGETHINSQQTDFGENTGQCLIHHSVFCRHVMHYRFGKKGIAPLGLNWRLCCRSRDKSWHLQSMCDKLVRSSPQEKHTPSETKPDLTKFHSSVPPPASAMGSNQLRISLGENPGKYLISRFFAGMRCYSALGRMIIFFGTSAATLLQLP